MKGIQLSCIWLDETWQYFSFSFLSIHRLLLYVVTCVVTVQYGFDICYIVLFSLFEYFSSVRKQVCTQTLKSRDQKKDFVFVFCFENSSDLIFFQLLQIRGCKRSDNFLTEYLFNMLLKVSIRFNSLEQFKF